MQIKIKKLAKYTKKYCKNHQRTVWFGGLSLFMAVGILCGSQLRASQIEVQLAQKQLQYSNDISKIKSIHTAKKLAAKSKSTQQTDVSSQASAPATTPTTPPVSQPAEPAPANVTTPKPSTATSPTSTPPPAVAAKPAPAPPAAPTPPATTETSSSLSFINSLRAPLGKPALSSNATMNAWALAHAQAQAASCGIYHQSLSPFLGRNIGPTTLSGIAENVGYASTINAVLNGLKNSPGHYANMTGDYTYVGIGVVTATSGSCAGYVYTTQMFGK